MGNCSGAKLPERLRSKKARAREGMVLRVSQMCSTRSLGLKGADTTFSDFLLFRIACRQGFLPVVKHFVEKDSMTETARGRAAILRTISVLSRPDPEMFADEPKDTAKLKFRAFAVDLRHVSILLYLVELSGTDSHFDIAWDQLDLGSVPDFVRAMVCPAQASLFCEAARFAPLPAKLGQCRVAQVAVFHGVCRAGDQVMLRRLLSDPRLSPSFFADAPSFGGGGYTCSDIIRDAIDFPVGIVRQLVEDDRICRDPESCTVALAKAAAREKLEHFQVLLECPVADPLFAVRSQEVVQPDFSADFLRPYRRRDHKNDTMHFVIKIPFERRMPFVRAVVEHGLVLKSRAGMATLLEAACNCQYTAEKEELFDLVLPKIDDVGQFDNQLLCTVASGLAPDSVFDRVISMDGLDPTANGFVLFTNASDFKRDRALRLVRHPRVDATDPELFVVICKSGSSTLVKELVRKHRVPLTHAAVEAAAAAASHNDGALRFLAKEYWDSEDLVIIENVFIEACARNRFVAVKVLLSENVIDLAVHGDHALNLALQARSSSVLEVLMRYKEIDVTFQNNLLLREAVKGHRNHAARLLLMREEVDPLDRPEGQDEPSALQHAIKTNTMLLKTMLHHPKAHNVLEHCAEGKVSVSATKRLKRELRKLETQVLAATHVALRPPPNGVPVGAWVRILSLAFGDRVFRRGMGSSTVFEISNKLFHRLIDTLPPQDKTFPRESQGEDSEEDLSSHPPSGERHLLRLVRRPGVESLAPGCKLQKSWRVNFPAKKVPRGGTPTRTRIA